MIEDALRMVAPRALEGEASRIARAVPASLEIAATGGRSSRC